MLDAEVMELVPKQPILMTFPFRRRKYLRKMLRARVEVNYRKVLERNLSQYIAITEYSQDAIISLSREGKIQTWNPAAERLFGYAKKEILGQSVFRLVPLGYGGITQQNLKLIREGIIVPRQRVKRLKKSGEIFDASLSVSPILDAKGAVIGASWIVRDISQEVKDQALIRKLSQAVEQTDDMVMITDTAGIIEYVNPAFEKYSGYSHAEVMGKTPSFLKSGKQEASCYYELWETILRGDVYRNTLINKRKDDVLFASEKTISPLRDGEGKVTHFVSTDKVRSQL